METADALDTIRLDEQVIRLLRGHEDELRAAGISGLSIFGSVARGEHGPESDVDLAAELHRPTKIGLFALIGLERRLSELLGRPVDLVILPVSKPRLAANIERDKQLVF